MDLMLLLQRVRFQRIFRTAVYVRENRKTKNCIRQIEVMFGRI